MDQKLFDLTNEMKEAMKNDPRFILLNKLEKEVNENEEIMSLAYRKDLAITNYSDLLKIYNENAPEVEGARKALYQAKLALDNHPLIIEYNKAYKEVKDVLDNVNNIIFDSFSK